MKKQRLENERNIKSPLGPSKAKTLRSFGKVIVY